MLCITLCVAAVFVRRTNTAATQIESLGGERVSAEEIRVNGKTGQMDLYRFDRSYSRAWESLAAAASGDSHSSLLTWDAETRILGLPSEHAHGGLVIVISGEQNKGAASWPWNDITPPFGATWGFSVEMRQGRTSMVTGTHHGNPEVIKAQVLSRLASAGWRTASPAASATTLTLLTRRNEVMLVGAFPDSIILLRQKPR